MLKEYLITREHCLVILWNRETNSLAPACSLHSHHVIRVTWCSHIKIVIFGVCGGCTHHSSILKCWRRCKWGFIKIVRAFSKDQGRCGKSLSTFISLKDLWYFFLSLRGHIKRWLHYRCLFVIYLKRFRLLWALCKRLFMNLNCVTYYA